MNLVLLAANGNRLAQQYRMDAALPGWCAEDAVVARQMLQVFSRAAIFFGDAELSPGVSHFPVYRQMVPLYQQELISQ